MLEHLTDCIAMFANKFEIEQGYLSPLLFVCNEKATALYRNNLWLISSLQIPKSEDLGLRSACRLQSRLAASRFIEDSNPSLSTQPLSRAIVCSGCIFYWWLRLGNSHQHFRHFCPCLYCLPSPVSLEFSSKRRQQAEGEFKQSQREISSERRPSLKTWVSFALSMKDGPDGT